MPLHFSGSSSPYNLTVSDARELFGFQYLAGISDLNFIFGQNHMAAALSCQSQIAMAVVEWHHGSFVPLTGLVWFSPPASFAALRDNDSLILMSEMFYAI